MKKQNTCIAQGAIHLSYASIKNTSARTAGLCSGIPAPANTDSWQTYLAHRLRSTIDAPVSITRARSALFFQSKIDMEQQKLHTGGMGMNKTGSANLEKTKFEPPQVKWSVEEGSNFGASLLVNAIFGLADEAEFMEPDELVQKKWEIIEDSIAQCFNTITGVTLNCEPFKKRLDRIVSMMQADYALCPNGSTVSNALCYCLSSYKYGENSAFIYLVSILAGNQKLQKKMKSITVEAKHLATALWITVLSDEQMFDLCDIPDGNTFNFKNFFYPLSENPERCLFAQQTAVVLAVLDNYAEIAARPVKGKAAEAAAIKRGEEALKRAHEEAQAQIAQEVAAAKEDSKKKIALITERHKKRENDLSRVIRDQDMELYALRKENERLRAVLEKAAQQESASTERNNDAAGENEAAETAAPQNIDEICSEPLSDEELPELPKDNVVFLGGAPNLVKKLRQIYPDWSYVGSEGITSSYSIPSNPIICFCWSKYMSHAMTYSVGARIDAPIAYVTKTNIEALEREMREGFKKVLNG